MRFQPFRTAALGRLAVIGVALLCLAACQGSDGGIPKQLRPVPPVLVGKMSELSMKATSPIFIRIFKESSEFEVWKQTTSGSYALLKTYQICKWSGELGPKRVEGDRQAPEGFYTVTPAQMNPNSSYYLSFNIGYPNAYDRSLGRTGSNLMVHGACSSAGCYSMTDDDAGEIFALARDSFRGGQTSFQIQALPFRMTAENLARHRDDPNMPFWKMLKVGYDTFELTRRPPKVDVCDRHYVLNADFGGASVDASSPCPAYSVPDSLAQSLASKQAADDSAFAVASVQLDEQDKRAEEDKQRAAAAQAVADERAAERAAERDNQPSLVSRMLAKVGIVPDATPPAATTRVPAAPPAAVSPKPGPKVVASVPKPRARPDDVPGASIAPDAATAVPDAAAPVGAAPDATVAVAPLPDAATTPDTAAPDVDATATATTTGASPVITPDMTPAIPRVGKFVKKKFLWDDETGDGTGSGAESGSTGG